ncbi:hypothetical protein ONZ45_g3144 [Pleurotus djamor]|nr:hypothetical protein ONZ45_g3144 [Pleurotus djamor]
MSDAHKRTLLVSGLQVNVYCHPSALSKKLPVSALFFLHGRTNSMQKTEPIIKSLVMQAHSASTQKDLYVIALDHRNHGTRLVNNQANLDWKEVAAVRDVSHLIDVLPAHLFPNDDREIVEWGIAGISLGGHSSWLALAHEPRITYGIPILGCADYISLMSERAKSSNVVFAAPAFPLSLTHLVGQKDPVSVPFDKASVENPFFGKKILALRGGVDELVPWSATAGFFARLQVGQRGFKQVRVQDAVGHVCTPEMTTWAAIFLIKEILSSDTSGIAKL